MKTQNKPNIKRPENKDSQSSKEKKTTGKNSDTQSVMAEMKIRTSRPVKKK